MFSLRLAGSSAAFRSAGASEMAVHCGRRLTMRYLPFLLLALPMALPAQEAEPSLRTTTSEVLLDFVVRDKNARIVHNIRPDEVRVFEDGVQQKLRHFQFYDGRKAGIEPGWPGDPSEPTSTSSNVT